MSKQTWSEKSLARPDCRAPRSRTFWRAWRSRFVVPLAFFWLLVPAVARADSLSKEILDATGGHRTKIVWARGSRDEGGKLMCFDTIDGKERVLVDRTDCEDPRLSPDGTRILFSRRSDQTAYIINWDGTGLRKLFSGRYYNVLGLATDPKTGVEWVYVGDNWGKEAMAEIKERGIQASEDSGLKLYRHRLSNLDEKELVWDKIPFNRRTYVTADGSKIFGELPWPNCGVATLPNGAFKQYATGCNANLAPDGSGRFFNLIGDHRTLNFYNADGSRLGKNVTITDMPGLDKDPKRSFWRPRWSNDVRFFTVQSADLGPDADICLGMFKDDFSGVKRWVRITNTPEYDADSTAWIEPGNLSAPASSASTPPSKEPAAGAWPSNRDGVVFLWQSGDRLKSPSVAFDKDGKKIDGYAPIARNRALFGRDYEMVLRGGSFHARGVGEHLSQAVSRAGAFSLEMYVRPPAQPPTNGARLVAYSSAADTLLTIVQKGNILYLGQSNGLPGTNVKGWIELTTIADAQPLHLVVTCSPKEVVVYRDGQQVSRIETQFIRESWPAGELIFGDNWDATENWPGRLEGIAIYPRALPSEEVKQNAKAYAAIVGARKPVASVQVKATLVNRSPSRIDIAPYFRAMSLFEYRVNKVLSGKCDQQVIYVFTWTVMQRKLLPAANQTVGREYTLTIEPFTAHAQLEPELQFDTLERNLDLPVHYDVTGQ